ncbi:hypothetical protein [Halobellus ordinarius]|nr:hypothetical protein [Halobellus sp. ZY16]
MTSASEDTESNGWRRVWDALLAAGRWALDVFRGHAGSRHLEQRRK